MYRGAEYYNDQVERRGKVAEFFIFGRVKIDNPDYAKGLKQCLGKEGKERVDCALNLVKQYQPFDPEKPQKKFMRDILEYFRDNAGFKEGKDKGQGQDLYGIRFDC